MPLRYTVFLFTIATHCARGDWLYHPVLLALTCTSIVRHWVAHATPSIINIDRFAAHACYALCAYTHLVEYPNAAGAFCLIAVGSLWIYEHQVQDWRAVHAWLHVVAVVGILIAVYSRVAPT